MLQLLGATMSAKHSEQYTQCRFQRPTGNGVQETTSWIPSRFAVVGRYVKLRLPNKEWVDGWKVISRGATASREETRERSQDHKNQRKASDV